MAQYHPQQPQYNYTSAGPTISSNVYEEQGDLGVDRPTKKRRNDLGSIVDALYQATLRTQPGEQAPVRINQRKNRNEVYALANAMLVKDIHLNGTKYSRDIALCRGLTTSVHHGDFILILRLDGRILVLSEEAEQHLGKSMRSLYSQCINIFDCLDTTDGNELRSILAASARDQGEEHRLVCTFRLPKGKRPSRVNEDIKTMFMAGHFYSCHDRSSTGDQEKIFVARCHALVSGTTHGTSSSQGDCMVTNSQTMIKIKLNDDMAISDVSSNVEEILGYRRHELMGTWFGRVVATDDLSTFENNRMKCFQSDQAQTATAPTTICDIFDLYTKFGDGRLTFLYQIRPIRERRARTPKFLITAQLIDPSLRNEYSKYLQVETASSNQKKSVKVEQVNLVSPAISKTTEDAVLAYSPSLSGGLLMSDSVSEYGDASQQYSPLRRSLSKHVTPIDFFDPSWPDIFDFNNEHQYLVTNNCDYACSMDQAIDNCFDPFFDPFWMIEDAFF